MDFDINWRVTDLTRDLSDGFVMKVNYVAEIVHKETDGVTYSFARSSELSFDRPETLIPYSELTNDIVIGWIQEQLGIETCKQIEDSLTAEINEQRSPTLGYGFPWPSSVEPDDSVEDETVDGSEDETVDGGEDIPIE